MEWGFRVKLTPMEVTPPLRVAVVGARHRQYFGTYNNFTGAVPLLARQA